MIMPPAVDRGAPIVILGGGLVGMVCALSLHRRGIPSVLHDARACGSARNDPRILALSYGSRLILDALDMAYDRLSPMAIHSIHVGATQPRMSLRLTAQEARVPVLGEVVCAGSLAGALERALSASGYVMHTGETLHAPLHSPLQDAPLVIHAEGSPVPGTSGGSACLIPQVRYGYRDYAQTALVCTARARQAHHNQAWEQFTPDGAVAAFPYGDDHSVALVLTVEAHATAAVMALSDADFLALLDRRFEGCLPLEALSSSRSAWPLHLFYRHQVVASRAVWIGNAAQTMHPVAAQGFNLALRDVHTLVRHISRAQDPGDAHMLAQYQAERQIDRSATLMATDFLAHGFTRAGAGMISACSAGFFALRAWPGLRGFLTRRFIFGARAW
jgi:2-octaprenyl-6-methoxyphenol hydroxylase